MNKIISRVIRASVLCGLLMIGSVCLTACAGTEPEVTSQVMVDRIPIDYTQSAFEQAITAPESAVMNYITHLIKGDYEQAMQYVDTKTTLFDAASLQRMVLSEGIGRGDKAIFYDVTAYAGSNNTGNTTDAQGRNLYSCDVEYDLEYSGMTNTVNYTVCLVQDGGHYYIDPVESGWVMTGRVMFQAPKYADIYLNGVLVPKTYMGNDYVYDMTCSFPRNMTTGTTPQYDDEGNEIVSNGYTLTVKTNFKYKDSSGADKVLEQDFDCVFLGDSTVSGTAILNDNSCYDYVNNRTVLYVTIPRELREQAVSYVEKTVLPIMLNDIVQGTSWEVSNFKTLFGEGTNENNMYSAYYTAASSFANAKNGAISHTYFEVTPYNTICDDNSASIFNYQNTVIDYNVIGLFITYDYHYRMLLGGGERNVESSNSAYMLLSQNADGEWYIHDVQGLSPFSVVAQ